MTVAVLLTRCLMAAFLANLACASSPVVGGPRIDEQARAPQEFTDRVQDYVALHRRLAAGLPPLRQTDDPERIVAHQKALAEAIRTVRADAKEGDIFTPSASRHFRRIIRADLKRRTRRDTAAALSEAPKVPLQVNDVYPESAPLATVPPMLLRRLQPLPEELEYRFVDRHLILLDIKANVIVDFIPDAVPSAEL